MENIIKQPPIIRLPHFGLMALGIILVILAVLSEPYILQNRSGIIVLAIALGLLIVECTLFTIIIRSMISKKTKLNNWSKKNRIIAFIVIITAFVWTLMLYEICKGVYYNIFA
jgi:amino acid transporter